MASFRRQSDNIECSHSPSKRLGFSQNAGRRTSVVPSAIPNNQKLQRLSGGSLSAPSNSMSKLRKMSILFHVDQLDSMIRSDPAKDENGRLSEQYEELAEESKRLKSYIDDLRTQFESSKELDVFRRYVELKSCIKRTVMHLKVSDVGEIAHMAKAKERERKREEKYKDMTSEEILQENHKLEELIKFHQHKIDSYIEAIQDLDSQYDSCKSALPFQRYQAMKTMIKAVAYSPKLENLNEKMNDRETNQFAD